MAIYQYPMFVTQQHHPAFGAISEPGDSTPHSGLYRCEGCGREVTSVSPHPLPPQNHHQHNRTQGRIRWRLIVAAAHN